MSGAACDDIVSQFRVMFRIRHQSRGYFSECEIFSYCIVYYVYQKTVCLCVHGIKFVVCDSPIYILAQRPSNDDEQYYGIPVQVRPGCCGEGPSCISAARMLSAHRGAL